MTGSRQLSKQWALPLLQRYAIFFLRDLVFANIYYGLTILFRIPRVIEVDRLGVVNSILCDISVSDDYE